jgi:predicted membrane-bound dolichyl-phosphate-mannose-protein mannosyltransferase
VVSLGARAAWLGAPCRGSCRTPAAHRLIFDEAYYVNAARVIAGLAVPPGQPYAGAPAGDDPNSEHPQLVKLIIAGAIDLLGDGPLAWRLGSLGFGSLAILGMFALVRAADGGPGLALGAATLMALDNLLLVHGRIGTLDIYVVAFMLWSAVFYLRGRPLAAGVVLGLGATAKLVAPYALVVFALLEAARVRPAGAARPGLRVRPALRRLAGCATATAATFVGLLAFFDRLAPPYDPGAGKAVAGGVLGHIGHLVGYAAAQTSPRGPRGIASYPWQWLFDYKPIVYLNVDAARRAGASLVSTTHFLGLINPVILVLALPAVAVAARRTRRGGGAAIDRLGVAWCLGTLVPFELVSLIWQRTTYLYYMVIVMPGVYLIVARLLAHPRVPRWAVAVWLVLALAAAVLAYPFTPLPDLRLV